MRLGRTLFLGGIVLALTAPVAHGQNFLDQNYGFDVDEDIVYGQGQVNVPNTHNENLLADIYVPTGAETPRKRPALICVHGGRWKFENKDAIENSEVLAPGEPYDTVGVYAREFAKRGYVTMSIDYRLIGSAPTGSGLLAQTPGFSTSALVSRLQGLLSPTPTPSECIAAVEAAIADTQRAVQWLRLHANDYDVDVNRIAVGGWAAGAYSAILAAYAGGADVSAVWMNSGGTFGNEFLISPGGPSVILFHGDFDAEIPVFESQNLNLALDAASVPNAYYEMQNVTHFYTRNVIVPPTAAKGGLTLEDALAEFLHAQLSLADLEAENAIPVPVSGGLVMTVLSALLSVAGVLLLHRPKVQPVRISNN